MSLKSHYGWHSARAEADFLWFSGDGEEMRGAKSPRRRVRTPGPGTFEMSARPRQGRVWGN